MAQRFVNIVLAFAFFIEPVALQDNRLRCYQGIIGAEVPYELSLRLAKLDISHGPDMTECVSDDRVCTFFECKAQDWYFASCSRQYAFCSFEMHEYCAQDKCQTCHTDHCNLPLSMRPNSTTTTRATSTSSVPLVMHSNSTNDDDQSKTTHIPETTMQDGHNKTNSENGTSDQVQVVEVPLAQKGNGTVKSGVLSAKVASLYVLALLLAISQAFLWFIEKMPWV
uniref:Chitin-binding type-2 domain-containing protein n=1 Tax=Globodera rostochiensis TaxID=31243 RepID=A0A914H685_GLORO